jgi:EmrB/QacA subfamily drug resistance transporter
MSGPLREPCDAAQAACGRAVAPAPRASRPAVLAATILGSSMAFVDGTVVNVALPRIQSEFAASIPQVQWLVEAYALALAALLLPGGSLGDRYGRRRIFAIGAAGFTVTSALCGLAPTIGILVAARALQGVSGALLVPGSLAILSASFRAEERGRAIGTWSALTGVAGAAGPVLGGWLVEAASWRFAFSVNVPIGAAVIFLTLTRVPESRGRETRGLDLAGAALAALGLGLLVYGLIEWPRLGRAHPAVLGTMAGGLAALALFLLVERRSAAAMMPLDLFRSREFVGANLLTLFLYAALGGALFYLPFNLIQVQGYTPAAAGAALLPFVLLLFLLSRWAGGLVTRLGARLPLTLGPAIAAAGFLLLSGPAISESYWRSFFPGVLVLGLGMAVTVAPLTATVMGSAERERAGIASGVNNAVSRVAALLAIAVLGVVLQGGFERALGRRLDRLELPPPARASVEGNRLLLAAAAPPEELPVESRKAVRGAVEASFVTGFRHVMWVAAGLSLASAAGAFALIGGRRRSGRAAGS